MEQKDIEKSKEQCSTNSTILHEEGEQAEMDRISLLPDHVIDMILENLSTKEAARTSILSKRWEMLWSTFPTINIIEKDFLERGNFMECLQLRLSYHDMRNLDNLRIRLVNYIYKELCQLIDRFIEAAIESKAKEMVLISTSARFSYERVMSSSEIYYLLPEVTFTSGAFFKSLNFEGCRFEAAGNFIKFPFLKEMFIRNCVFSESFFTALIHGSPSMETLSFKYCEGLKVVKFSHSKLKTLVFGCNKSWEMFEVDAPDLESFKYGGFCYFFNLSENREFEPCHKLRSPKLKSLYLKHGCFQVEMFQRLLSSFPNLEKMVLRRCRFNKGPTFSGENLQTLLISTCKFQDEIEIIAPNLHTLDYIHNELGSRWTEFIFQHLRKLWLVNITITFDEFHVTESNFPFLEYLNLDSCTGLQYLEIISSNLKSFGVFKCDDVKKYKVNAPNLVSLNYTGPVVNFSQLAIGF